MREATTQHYLNIADIREDVLILKNGEFRQILEIQALNFALKSEQEQAAIIYQYQAFLNSLQFPIQILVQSRRLDLTKYLADLRGKGQSTNNQLMRAQISDYLDFISRLISLGNIMEKHFYVIVPYASPSIRGGNIVGQLLKRDTVSMTDKQFTEGREKLIDRTAGVQSGLASLGLAVTPLAGDQIVKVLYSTYNPVEADEATFTPPTMAH